MTPQPTLLSRPFHTLAHAQGAWSRRMRALVLALMPAAGGCGGSSDPAPVPDFVRLSLGSTVVAPVTNPIVHTWVPTSGAAPELSRGVAGSVETLQLRRNVDGPDEPHAALVVREPAEAWTLAIRIPDEAPAFNEVTLEYMIDGETSGSFVTEYVAAGASVAVSPSHVLAPGRVMESRSSLFPEARRAGGKAREVRLHFSDQATFVAVLAVHTSQRAWQSFLPASDGSDLHRVGGVWRRAVGLERGATVELGELRVPRGSHLSFHVSLAPRLHSPLDRAELELTLESRRGEPIETRRFVVSREALEAWERVTFTFEGDVAGIGRVRLVSSDREDFVLVADAMVARRVAAAPTVVFITSDTHRADHMGYVGAPSLVSTPNLDALSRRGARFLDCFAPTTTTNPSHIAMMTGTSPRDTRIVNNTTELGMRAWTLAEAFAGAGYRTLAVVSAPHLTPPRSGLGQGFDRFEGSEVDVPDAERSVAAALAQLDEAEGLPVFLWLHLFDAHSPYGPPEPFDRKYYPRDGDPRSSQHDLGVVDNCIPPWLDGVRDRDYFHAQYRAEVDYLDHALGRLLNQPRVRAGIVAFTADHGESFGQHGIYWNHVGLYPDTVRVPLILSWPGAPGAVEVGEPTEALDIGRTLLDLAGATAAQFPGRDLRWSLAENPARQARFTLDGSDLAASISARGWHLILHLVPHRSTGETIWRDRGELELYDLVDDPGCTRNVVLDELPRAKLMHRHLLQWLDGADLAGLGAGESDLDSRALALLEQLGYADSSGTKAGQPLWDAAHPDLARSPWTRILGDTEFDMNKARALVDYKTYKGR